MIVYLQIPELTEPSHLPNCPSIDINYFIEVSLMFYLVF